MPCASSVVSDAPVCRAIDSLGSVASHPFSISTSMRRPLETTSVLPTARSWTAISFANAASAGASLGWGACIAAMYWIARSCTCSGIVIKTVGLVVGTGRGGMTRPGPGADASAAGGGVAGAGATDALVAVLRSASGPVLSQARVSAKARNNGPRDMGAILIRHEAVRKLFVALVCGVSLGREDLAHGQGATKDAGAMRAEMRCEHIDAPGRLRCEVEARVLPGESIALGDVIIVRTPPFVTALRGRIGPNDATTRDAEVWRWALALAARARGHGDIEARARLVVCRNRTCEPREAPLVAHLVVGD
jgi:hypothetical protein